MSKFIPTKDLDSLSIQQLFFHRIEKDMSNPIFLSEVVIDERQYEFFENIIRIAISKSIEFSFLEEESEAVLTMIEILEDPEDQFLGYTKTLSSLFMAEHQGNSNDGVLLFAQVTIGTQKMLFIAKMDDQSVLTYDLEELPEGNRKAAVKTIRKNLVEHESAIQKAALIDIDAIYDWDVLAIDRQKNGQGLADYFKRFLHVQEKEINAILSTQVVAEVQKWATKNSEEVLLPAEHVADYKERAVSYLRAASEFDSHELMNMVIPEEENLERKQDLSQSLYEHLEKSDLTDRKFAPEAEGIRASVIKNSIKTKEGVSITWEGDMDSHGVSIQEVDGQMQIIISTDDYTFK